MRDGTTLTSDGRARKARLNDSIVSDDRQRE